MKPWILVRSEHALMRLGGRTLLGRLLEILRRENRPAEGVICPEPLVAQVKDELTSAITPCRLVLPSEFLPLVNESKEENLLLIDAGVLFDQRLIKTGLDWNEASVLLDSRPADGQKTFSRVKGHSFAGMAALPARKISELLDTGSSIFNLTEELDGIDKLAICDIEGLPPYHPPIRRALRPFWVPIEDSGDIRHARWTLARSMSKGHMEWLVYLLNRPVETFLSYFLAETRITPNQITIVCNLVAFGACALFALGHLWIGVLLSLFVGILDGLDGRQARIQIKTSKLGEIEHFFDKIYEISWMAALGWHFSAGLTNMPEVWAAVGWIAAHIIDGGAYYFYRAKSGMMIDEATKTDAVIRFFAGCRNTSMAILLIGLIVGRPLSFFWFIVWLNGATAVIHWLRTAVLLSSRRQK